MKEYKTLHQYGEDEITIEKSLFIGYAKPVSCEEEARAFIDEIKQKHKDATHNVWAYTVGESMNIQRYSDDGEPQGTAGIPTLEVIKKEDLRNIAVVVTRYFGGIKLGAGGLVRAYTKGAKIGIEAGIVVERKVFAKIVITTEYTMLGKIQNSLSEKEYIVDDIEYTENVIIVVFCEKERVEKLVSLITELTSANAGIKDEGEFYLSVKDGKVIK